MRRLVAAVVIALLALPTLSMGAVRAGQAGQTASLSGTATADGKPIPNARVQLRNVNTGQLEGTATTNANGSFTFSGLQQGTYAVEVQSATGAIVGTSAATAVAAGAQVTGVSVGASAAAVAGAAGAGAAAAGGAAAGGAAGAGISTAVIVTTVAIAAGVAGAIAIANSNSSPSR